MFKLSLNNNNSTLLIEEINNSIEELQNLVNLNNEDKTKFLSFKNNRRKKEWLAVRYLLKKACNDNTNIIYNTEGKPSLSNGKNISISHSQNYVGIIISNNEHIGLDIEKISHKLERIKHKFLNNTELDIVNNSDKPIETLTKFWCTKETLYKIHSKGNIIFDKQLIIKKIDEDKQIIFAKIKTNKVLELELNYRKIDDYYFVWVF